MLRVDGLRGVYVPLVAPFREDGTLDLASFRRYVDAIAVRDIAGIVINGTTGESLTVSEEETALLMGVARESLRDSRLPIILGTGTPDTASTIRLTERADRLGADAALVVVPYYSRPSQQGIIEHYRQVARTGMPIIAYDNPSRTGIRLESDTLRAILDIDGVIGLKDSTEGVGVVSELTRTTGKPVLCGADEHWYASLCAGARGGILAAANTRTDEYAAVMRLVAAGELQEAKAAFDRLLPLVRLLFREPNPSPLKWLLAEQGIIASDSVRLPLVAVSNELRTELLPHAAI